MSHSEVTSGTENEESAELAEVPALDNRADGSVPVNGHAREPTGDHAVDEVLRELDAVTDELLDTQKSLDTQIEVGEKVHRILQGRLADLGKE